MMIRQMATDETKYFVRSMDSSVYHESDEDRQRKKQQTPTYKKFIDKFIIIHERTKQLNYTLYTPH